MIYKAYSMYDKVVKNYGHPSFFISDEVMIRSVKVSIKSPGSQLAPIINDIDFYCIGSFNDETGVFEKLPVLELVFRGDSLYGQNAS